MSKLKIIILVLVCIVLVAGGVLGYQTYIQIFHYPTSSPSGEYMLVVQSGDTAEKIAQKLASDKAIYDVNSFLINEKLQPLIDLQVGEYTLKLPANPSDLIKQINVQAKIIQQKNLELGGRKSVMITLREGLTLDDYIEILVQNQVFPSAEILQNYAKNPTNFDRTIYPFLPEPLDCEYGNIAVCAKYYPEGYLYPDTYQFFINSEPEEIFNKMLSNFNIKVWSRIKAQVNNQQVDFAKIVIMASVIEKESGRTTGITPDKLEEVNIERRNIAQVFYNRIDLEMKWQSDITIEYGLNRQVCQQTFEVPNCFFLDDKIAQHKYNTYLQPSYPIGPITNPDYHNVYAALNPIDNDYLYFVSDVTGKTYFGTTEEDRQNIIQQASEANRALGE